MSPTTAVKYDVQVKKNGKVELSVPFPEGSHITILVIGTPKDNLSDLLAAAQSSTDFWDNPIDDEDWNNV